MNNKESTAKADLEGVTHYQFFVEWYRIPNDLLIVSWLDIYHSEHPEVIKAIEEKGYWNDCNIFYCAVCEIPPANV